MTTSPYSGWAVVELMGHRQRAGQISEAEQFGTRLLRIDIPAGDETVTEFYGGAAIYAIRPCSEDAGRHYAARFGDIRPVAPVQLRLPSTPEASEPEADESEAHEAEFEPLGDDDFVAKDDWA